MEAVLLVSGEKGVAANGMTADILNIAAGADGDGR